MSAVLNGLNSGTWQWVDMGDEESCFSIPCLPFFRSLETRFSTPVDVEEVAHGNSRLNQRSRSLIALKPPQSLASSPSSKCGGFLRAPHQIITNDDTQSLRVTLTSRTDARYDESITHGRGVGTVSSEGILCLFADRVMIGGGGGAHIFQHGLDRLAAARLSSRVA